MIEYNEARYELVMLEVEFYEYMKLVAMNLNPNHTF